MFYDTQELVAAVMALLDAQRVRCRQVCRRYEASYANLEGLKDSQAMHGCNNHNKWIRLGQANVGMMPLHSSIRNHAC